MAVLKRRGRPALAGVVFGGLLAGCGLGGGGGSLQVSSFPQSGLGTFRLLLPEEVPLLQAPYVAQPTGLDADEPAVLVEGDEADAAGLRIFFTAQQRGTATSSIAQVQAPSLEAGAGEPRTVVVADRPWEGGIVRNPAVLRDVPGLPRYALFYQGREGSLGFAVSEDGETFRKAPERVLSVADLGPGEWEVAGPVYLPETGRLRAYLLGGGTRLISAELDLDSLLRAVNSPTAGAPRWDLAPLPLRPEDFAIPVGTSSSVPADRLSGASVRRLLTPGDRARFDLFVIAEGGEAGNRRRAATAAASYDGVAFAALLPTKPFLGRISGVAAAPVVVTYRTRALLVLGLRPSPASPSGLAAGLIP